MADDFIDDILKVQCELLHCQVLTLWGSGRRGRGRDCALQASWGCLLFCLLPVPTCTEARSRMGLRLRPRRSVTTKGREILSSSNSEEAGRGSRDGGRPEAHSRPASHAQGPACWVDSLLTILWLCPFAGPQHVIQLRVVDIARLRGWLLRCRGAVLGCYLSTWDYRFRGWAAAAAGGPRVGEWLSFL